MASRNHCARGDVVFLAFLGALMAGGCSVTMPLSGVTGEEEITGNSHKLITVEGTPAMVNDLAILYVPSPFSKF